MKASHILMSEFGPPYLVKRESNVRTEENLTSLFSRIEFKGTEDRQALASEYTKG